MKRFTVLLFTTVAISSAAVAQCDKDQILLSSKTEYLNKDSTISRTVDESTTIEINKKTVTIMPGNDHTMIGEINSVECNWKQPFKEGKSVIKALVEDRGTMINITLTIEGRAGKVFMIATMDIAPDKIIRVWADSYEEKK